MVDAVSNKEVQKESSEFNSKKLIGIFFLLVFLSHIALNTGLTGRLYSPALKQLILTGLSLWAAFAYLFDKGFARGAATIYLVWRSITFLIALGMVGTGLIFGVVLTLAVYISMLFVIWRKSSSIAGAQSAPESQLTGFSLTIVIFCCFWVVYTTSVVLISNI